MSKQIVKEKNRGGPYTKKEQEERRIQVFHLHFEENKSAVQISELLNVNRNTINEDIRFWHLHLSKEIKFQDLGAKLKKQIQRMDIQRDRMLEALEEAESLDEKLKLEKSISDVDNRLVQLYSKMITSGIRNLEYPDKPEEITEDEVKGFVRDLILKDEDPYSNDVYSEDELRFLLIERKKCDLKHADNVIEKMRLEGLNLCNESRISLTNSFGSFDHSGTFNLVKFAILRGYVTPDELGSVLSKRRKIKAEIEKEKREEKFVAKYGPDKSKWSAEAKELYDNFKDPV